MKKRGRKYQHQSYRFTRWSGKSYSAFNSLGKEVNIGVLSYAITDKMGVKSASMPFQQKALLQDVPKEEKAGTKDELLDRLAIFWSLMILLLLGEMEKIESGIVKSESKQVQLFAVCLSFSPRFPEPTFLSLFSSTSQLLKITTVYLLNFSKGFSINLLKPVNYAF